MKWKMTKMAFSWSFKFRKFRKTTSFLPRNTIPVANLIQLRHNHTKHRKCLHFFSRFVLSNLWWLTPLTESHVKTASSVPSGPPRHITYSWNSWNSKADGFLTLSHTIALLALAPSHLILERFLHHPLPPALASGLPTRAQETLEAHLSLPLWGPLCHRQSWLPAAPTPKPFVNVAEQLTAAWCLCPTASP